MRTETWVMVFSISALMNIGLSILILFGLPIDRYLALNICLVLLLSMLVLLGSLDKLCDYWEPQAPGVQTTTSSKGVTK